MLKKITQLAVSSCLLLLATVVATPSPQEAQEKRPKDQAEYELITKAFDKDLAPQTKLGVLDEWSEKYPETAYKEERVRTYMRTYQAADQKEKAIEIAKQILADNPNDFEANFLITSMTPLLGSEAPGVLSTGETAAKKLLQGKPPALTDEQWAAAKAQVEQTAHQTLGWIYMTRKENEKAEEEFKTLLKMNPQNAQISYWLGNVVLAQGNPDKNELALFSYARATTLEGEGALAPQGREQVDAYLRKVYSKFHGSEKGLDRIKELAQQQPLPPPDLKIKSADEVKFEEDQKFREENPLLSKYLDLKENLLGPNGDAIWAELRGKLTPEIALYVVGADSNRPQVLNLSSEPGGSTEVVLNLENRLRAHPGNNRKIRVEGVASRLTKSPFRLTLTDGKVL